MRCIMRLLVAALCLSVAAEGHPLKRDDDEDSCYDCPPDAATIRPAHHGQVSCRTWFKSPRVSIADKRIEFFQKKAGRGQNCEKKEDGGCQLLLFGLEGIKVWVCGDAAEGLDCGEVADVMRSVFLQCPVDTRHTGHNHPYKWRASGAAYINDTDTWVAVTGAIVGHFHDSEQIFY